MDKTFRVLALTLHRAENYGSMLQAYALQEFVQDLDNNISYSILDFAPPVQKNMYKTVPQIKDARSFIKALVSIRYIRDLKLKKARFNGFAKNYLECTQMIDSEKKKLQAVVGSYDISIFGSDQIWNTNGKDFDWIFMGEGISGIRKISYAASMGSGYFNKDWNQEHRDKMKELLKDFSEISVRETGVKKIVENLCDLPVSQNIDPVFLLDGNSWVEKLKLKHATDEKYILFYSLNPDKLVLEIVKEISRILGLPVVVTKFNNMHDIVNPFRKKYDTGPIEFLNLLYNAELVLSTSFHGVAFAILLNKPFYAINPYSDSRLDSILESCSLNDRAIKDKKDIKTVRNRWHDLDFSNAKAFIESERTKATAYLSKYCVRK